MILARPFPLEHKKLMFTFRIMIMLMILMSLVGTKHNHTVKLQPSCTPSGHLMVFPLQFVVRVRS